MNLPHCSARRHFTGQTGMYFCAHPGVGIPGNIVTPAICRSCHARRQPAPETFRAFPFRQERLVNRLGIELVVARYREDISWLDAFRDLKVTIYDKGDPAAPRPLPNIGREAHTYLQHIVDRYDDLAEVSIFLQGHPFDHVRDLEQKIWSLSGAFEFRDLSDHILVENQHGEPVHPSLPLAELYEAIFGAVPPDHFLCHSGACFAVTRNSIRSRPREFYERVLRLVVEHPLGPWAIERLWQFLFRTKSHSEGVITAADAAYFADLQLLIRSLRAHDGCPLWVYDLGLYPEQIRWCLEQADVAVYPAPQLYRPVERIRQHHWWQTWLKPFYLFNAPFDRVLWIDADCVVLDNLNPVLESLRERPWLTPDASPATTQNDPRLYTQLPLAALTRTHGISVNAGVVGLCKIRDHRLLHAWAFAVQWAALNPGKRRWFAWADQGALLWAILRTDAAHHLQQNYAWNFPAGRIPTLLHSTIRNRRTVLDEIRSHFPQAHIVHWLGGDKLARQLAEQIQGVFA